MIAAFVDAAEKSSQLSVAHTSYVGTMQQEVEANRDRLEAYELADLEESGMEKRGELVVESDEELALVGDKGPVPYQALLTEEEYRSFREIAEKSDPTDDEVARGQDLLRLMMKRYPNGPGGK